MKRPGTLKERSHAMASLVRQSQVTLDGGANDNPMVVAQRYAMLNHCLCCNVLCKACVLDDGEAEKLENQMASPQSRRRSTASSNPLLDDIDGAKKQKKRFLSEEERHAKIILGLNRAHDPSSQIGDRNKNVPADGEEAPPEEDHTWERARKSAAAGDVTGDVVPDLPVPYA